MALSLIATSSLAADAFKAMDSQGRVIYSDKPIADGERLSLPASAADDAQSVSDPPAADGTVLGSYEAFEILAPSSGETLNSDDGRVQVSLLIDPPLQEGHRLDVQVDGTAVQELGGRTQFVLQGLPLGTHQLQARILDETGAATAQTEVLSFNLRADSPP